MNINQMKSCRVVLENFQTPKAQNALSAELRNALLERNILTSRTSKRLLNELNNIEADEISKKKYKLRLKVIKEILSSEEAYIKQLKTIKQYFMDPLKKNNILSNHDFNTLFGNIDTIFNVNKELVRELRKEPANVASAFLKLGPFLKIYSVYAYDYKKALSILQDVQSNNQEFNKFLQDQESRPEVQNKLSALLITPIQRVPRYRLLLKQVLDNTNPKDLDYKRLIVSLQKVEQAALHINNLVEEQENTQLLLELQRSLHMSQPNIIKPGRRFIKGGFLKKMARRSNHSYNRYMVLLNDIIMYCKPLKDKPSLPQSLKCSCILPLNKCRIVEMPNKGAFRLNCQDENLTFFHESAGEYEDWVREIKNALKKFMEDRQTLRKDSSARVPLRKKLLKEKEDKGLSPGRKMQKRNISGKDFENVFRSSKCDSEDSDEDTTTCFPKMSNKRSKHNNGYEYDEEDDYYKPKKMLKFSETTPTKDSLYPLRKREAIHSDDSIKICSFNISTNNAGNNNTIGSGDVTPNTCMALVPVDDVFIFGQENNRNGHSFNFSMRGIFTGIGNSFRRLFGLQRN